MPVEQKDKTKKQPRIIKLRDFGKLSGYVRFEWIASKIIKHTHGFAFYIFKLLGKLGKD